MSIASNGTRRLVAGLIQGLLLYVLVDLAKTGGPLADKASIFCPLFLVVLYVPTLIILNLGTMKSRTLVAWALAVTVLLVGLAVHDVARRTTLGATMYALHISDIYPSFSLMFFAAIGLFIGQCLVLTADLEGRPIASYPRYFDVAWKTAIQLNFSLAFVGIFWVILWLGTALFGLIKITFFSELIQHNWFRIPATALAMASAIHTTDVRVNLVQGIRTLKLLTMSRLLPIMTFFVAGFIVSLPFKGFELLWATHHASQLLLGAAAWLILLINATYQDGTPEHIPGPILRSSGTLAAVLLAPLVALAIYAVTLRAGAHGWTINLIDVFACLIVAACYAAGYLWAVARRGAWLQCIEKTNIYTSFVILAVLFVLFTPIADPARLSVADQMSRLNSGRVSTEKFDYMYLRNQGESYGEAALKQLKNATGPNAEFIKKKADQALAAPTMNPAPQAPLTQQEITDNITVYPPGRTLPDSFAKQDWSTDKQERWMVPQCLFNKTIKCDAFIVDAAATAPQQIILANDGAFGNATLFQSSDKGWGLVGTLSARFNCKGVHDALKAGQFTMLPASGQELDVGGLKIQVKQNEQCPPP
jgi:hypothetical protein